MDKQTVMYVTRALDIAINNVLRRQIDRLGEGVNSAAIAQSVLSSLRSLEGLQQGKMPNYNAWDAILYAAWYQPSHINMAYSLIRKVPSQFNPLSSGKSELSVEDFGCGQLAMQFGLLLAASDTLGSLGACPRISIRSTDPSAEMKELGWQVWHEFVAEIGEVKKYPTLHRLREACHRISFQHQASEDNVQWFSLLHVAYQESKASVRKAVEPSVEENCPEVILVTYHPGAKGNAFGPPDKSYEEEVYRLSEANLDLGWEFRRLTKLREWLYEEKVKGLLDNLENERFARSYLTAYPSNWVSHKFESECSVYLRADTIPLVNEEDLDDLPF